MNDTALQSGDGPLNHLDQILKKIKALTSSKSHDSKSIKITIIPTPLGEMIAGSTD